MTADSLARLQAGVQTHGTRGCARLLGLSPATLSLVLRGKYMTKTNYVESRVLAVLPPVDEADWITAWRIEAKRTSQAQAADLVGVSEATVSQVFNGAYKAATTRIERRVRGELMGFTCECPVMGDVSTRVCQDVQERQLPIANPQHRECFHACRGRGPYARAGACPNFNGGAKPPSTKE